MTKQYETIRDDAFRHRWAKAIDNFNSHGFMGSKWGGCHIILYERVNLPARRAHMQSHGAGRAPSLVTGIRCNRLHPDRRM